MHRVESYPHANLKFFESILTVTLFWLISTKVCKNEKVEGLRIAKSLTICPCGFGILVSSMHDFYYFLLPGEIHYR